MKILYFIEPYYEFDDPKFRIPTLKNIILPQIEKIYNEFNNEHEFIIFTSKDVINCCDFIFPEYINIYTIDIDTYNKFYSSSIQYALDACSNKNIYKIANEIKNKYNGIKPDIIINYESASENLLRIIFPDTKILNMMFGPFSRAPFPATTFLSIHGIYGKSEINTIRDRDLNDEEIEVMRKIRCRAMHCIAELNPIKKNN